MNAEQPGTRLGALLREAEHGTQVGIDHLL